MFQLGPTLCDPMDCSLPGSSVHGTLQAIHHGIGYHALLQVIYLTQRSKLYLLHLLHWQVDSLLFEPEKARLNPSLCSHWMQLKWLASLSLKPRLQPNPHHTSSPCPIPEDPFPPGCYKSTGMIRALSTQSSLYPLALTGKHLLPLLIHSPPPLPLLLFTSNFKKF